MLSTVTLICKAKEVLPNGYRMVELDNFDERGGKTFRFKVKYWNSKPTCRFMSFKEGTLLIINGVLENDEEGNTIVVAEKVRYLDQGDRKVSML